MRAAAAWLRRAAEREWGTPVRDVWRALVRDRWRAVPLTLVSVALICLLRILVAAGDAALVDAVGGVKAALPWWQALARTPLSLFVPAIDLPMWGALAQVLVVFGICEITLGRVRTLVIAYAATLAGTLFARWALAHEALGLAPRDAFTLDTGPSAAVVALAFCAAWHYRAWWTAAAVVAFASGEALLRPNLAGWEHLVALTVAGCLCLVHGARDRDR